MSTALLLITCCLAAGVPAYLVGKFQAWADARLADDLMLLIQKRP